MNENELKIMRELVYITNEIASCMAMHPDKTARQIAGDVTNPDDELARLARALKAAQAITAPWLDAL